MLFCFAFQSNRGIVMQLKLPGMSTPEPIPDLEPALSPEHLDHALEVLVRLIAQATRANHPVEENRDD